MKTIIITNQAGLKIAELATSIIDKDAASPMQSNPTTATDHFQVMEIKILISMAALDEDPHLKHILKIKPVTYHTQEIAEMVKYGGLGVYKLQKDGTLTEVLKETANPPKPVPEMLIISDNEISVEMGSTKEVGFTVSPIDATQTVTLSENAIGTATAEVEDGVITITGVAAGTTSLKVTATANSKVSRVISITVTPAED